MKIKSNINKNTKKKYPYRIYMDNGRIIPVPSQHNFKTAFIKNHGCSLVGFYMALRFLGVKKDMGQCKKYLDNHYGLNGRAKYSLRVVTKAINKIVSGSPAKFYKSASGEAITKALKRGDMVLFEERDSIHTVVLLWDGKQIRRFSDGKYKTVTVAQETNKRCRDAYYGGCVIVKQKGK